MRRLGWLFSPASLRARIFWSLVPIFLALFALVGMASIQLQRSLAAEEFRKRGVDLATGIAASSELGVLVEDAGLLELVMLSAMRDADVEFVVFYDAEGRPLAHSSSTAEAPPSEHLPETARARLAADLAAFASAGSLRARLLDFYAPVLSTSPGSADEQLLDLEPGAGSRGPAAAGFVRMGLSLEPMRRHTASLLRLWGGLAVVFLGLAVLAIYLFSRGITRPINLLTERSRDIAAGDLDQTIPVDSRDEIGQLASTFNEMARSLKSNVAAKEGLVEELRELNQSLEARIDRRTAELEELYRLSASMQEPLSLTEALSRVLDGARQLVGIDRICISTLSHDGERLIPISAAGLPDEEFERIRGTEIPVEPSAALTRVLREGATLLYADGALEPVAVRTEDLGARGSQAGDSVMVLMPVLSRGSPIGLLACDNHPTGRAIAERTLTVLQTFAAHAASAIENAQLFRELDEKGQEIEAANRHKSEFLANMSHELRTPLNAVIGFSEVLLERMFGELNEKQDEYLKDIHASGRHLLSLINDILDLSKIEAGQMELSPQAFSLAEAIDNAVTLVKERAHRRSVKLVTDLDACPASFVADERKFKQVLLNLLSNAVKFTSEGGSITLRAEEKGSAVEFSVTDTGIGISPADQARIFEAFRQAEGDYARKAEGTGLGLTLSRSIVELHGGRLWCESELGKGSTFTFALPLRQLGQADEPPAVADDPGPVAEESPELPPATADGDFVLVVEDDTASANLLAIHLRDAGFRVEVVHDGRSGLDLARSRHPQAIVLDLMLPELDGWEVLTCLKGDAQMADVPVIIVSNVDERGKGLSLGASDYLVKPVDAAGLVAAVRRVRDQTGAGTRVLAIDDDPRALELVRANLAPAGFSVLTAATGEEGLTSAQREQPDVIVLDLLLPGIDGFEVAKLLKDDPSTQHIPILILTAKSLSSVEKRRLFGRVEHLSQKSEFRREEFVALVAAAIQRRELWDRGDGV